MSSLEIEVIAGSVFGFERPPSDKIATPSRLRLHIPDDSRVYTLRNLVSELSSSNKHLEEMILDGKTGRIKGNTVILLNGVHMDVLDGLDTVVKAGDQVALVPFVDGG